MNGMEWTRIPGAPYLHNYEQIAADIAADPSIELQLYRDLILHDLWWFVYFVLQIKHANHPFVVDACREVQFNPDSHVLYLWAREHYKSTVISTARPIQRLLQNPERTFGIFSYARPAAKSFLRSIKAVLERSEILKACFPDVLYMEPQKEAPKWSEDEGLVCKRNGFQREASFEAWGLIEGMPTGKHFTDLIYDDVETMDLVQSPEMIQKTKDAYFVSLNLGTLDGTHTTVGTTYHHHALLTELRSKKREDGTNMYKLSLRPATDDGTPNGKPVLLSESRLSDLRTNKRTFFAQQLLDPTPQGEMKLDFKYVREVLTSEIPKDLYRFMTIDPAGEKRVKDGREDSWAMMVVGVDPYRDSIGASDVYILDLIAQPFSYEQAIQAAVDMYSRNGRILKLGVEKTGLSTAHIHLSNALRSKGKVVTEDSGGLMILSPRGREKFGRIEAAIGWPLNNGKIHMSAAVPKAYRDRFQMEMEKFPYWHDDVLDALSYVYDILTEYKFGLRTKPIDEKLDRYERAKRRRLEGSSMDKWMLC